MTTSNPMTKQHPITPSRKLAQQWTDQIYGGPGAVVGSDDLCLAKLAAQWGADMELEACVKLLTDLGGEGEMIRRYRRPKALKQQALKALEALRQRTTDPNIIEPLARALEALDG